MTVCRPARLSFFVAPIESIESVHNASMIRSGKSLVAEIKRTAGKLILSVNVIFSGEYSLEIWVFY